VAIVGESELDEGLREGGVVGVAMQILKDAVTRGGKRDVDQPPAVSVINPEVRGGSHVVERQVRGAENRHPPGARRGRISEAAFLDGLFETHGNVGDRFDLKLFRLVGRPGLFQGEQGMIMSDGDWIEVIGGVLPSLAEAVIDGAFRGGVEAPDRPGGDEDSRLA